MVTFKDLKLNEELQEAINSLGITVPTEIQEKSIPLILDGKDVLGGSATGSGKTLAFGCGVINRVIPKKGIQALILTPTRELAEQVMKNIRDLSKNQGIKITSIYGGVSMRPQISDLRRVEVVVGTPGRILDHIRQGTIELGRIKLLVLDEADRMLDMGFINDVEKIVSKCPKERQTLFFSATLSEDIRRLAHRYMILPEQVNAVKQVDASKLKQIFYDVNKNNKFSLLAHLLEDEKSGLVMVFSNTRRNTDFIVKNLNKIGIDALAIHGGLAQNKRTRTIEEFHNSKVGVLVCTDVAARGLHIDNISHIYNYDLPKDSKDYVHRIGRTARAGEKGKVINLVCKFDYEAFSEIRHDYSEFKIEEIEIPKIRRIETVRTDSRVSPRRGFQGGRASWDKPDRGRGRSSGGRDSGRSRDNDRGGGRDSGRSSGGRSFGNKRRPFNRNNDRSSGRSYGNRDGDEGRSRRDDSSHGDEGRSKGRYNQERSQDGMHSKKTSYRGSPSKNRSRKRKIQR